MAKLALIVIISTALMTGVAADPQNDSGLVAPELSRPTPGQLLRQDYITGTGATVPRRRRPAGVWSDGARPRHKAREQPYRQQHLRRLLRLYDFRCPANTPESERSCST